MQRLWSGTSAAASRASSPSASPRKCTTCAPLLQNALLFNEYLLQLTPEERLQLAARVASKAGKRVIVVGALPSASRMMDDQVASGTFGGDVAAQAEFVNAMGRIVDAVVVLTNQFAQQHEPDDVWCAKQL